MKKSLLLKAGLGGFLCCFGLLLTVSLIPSSLYRVEHDQLAIEYNNLTMKVSDDILIEGRYLLRPESHLFYFKRIVQTLDYTKGKELRCLTSEGLDMELDITVQYQLDKDELFEIFDEFGQEEEHQKYIDKLTRAELKDICTNFTGEDYFFKRGEVEQAMGDGLRQVYLDSHVHAEFSSIQLRNVKHPGAYEKANQAKQSEEQKKDKVLRERQERLTRADTDLKTAIVDAEIKMINATARANATIDQALSLAPAEIEKWRDRADALVEIKGEMPNITLHDFITQYFENIEVLSKQENPIISLDD